MDFYIHSSISFFIRCLTTLTEIITKPRSCFTHACRHLWYTTSPEILRRVRCISQALFINCSSTDSLFLGLPLLILAWPSGGKPLNTLRKSGEILLGSRPYSVNTGNLNRMIIVYKMNKIFPPSLGQNSTSLLTYYTKHNYRLLTFWTILYWSLMRPSLHSNCEHTTKK